MQAVRRYGALETERERMSRRLEDGRQDMAQEQRGLGESLKKVQDGAEVCGGRLKWFWRASMNQHKKQALRCSSDQGISRHRMSSLLREEK